MSEETYMTGEEAVEMGFVDELIQSDSTPEIAACADMSALIVGGRRITLYGIKCPENIPLVSLGDALDTSPTLAPSSLGAGANDIHINEGGYHMDNNTNGTANSALTAHAEGIDPAKKATEDERERLKRIDAIASQFSPDIVNAAKYESPCTAEEMAYRAAVQSAQAGKEFLTALNKDYEDSGASSVQPAPAPEDNPKSEENMTDSEKMAIARAEVRDVLGGEK